MAKVSVQAAAKQAKAAETEAVKQYAAIGNTHDSYFNSLLNIGAGTANAQAAGSYGFNPISRQRQMLEWTHRSEWIAGMAVDVIPDDMTRAGADLHADIDADRIADIETAAVDLRVWDTLARGLKTGRLYGGAIAVHLIDGQAYETPYREQSVGVGQYKGLFVLDRWMVAPSLTDLITIPGPDLGKPKYYTVNSAAPALRGMKIHHSRCSRFVGNELPYWQELGEQLWGMSVLERLFDLMSAYRSATMGTSQLMSKSYMRYLQVKGYRDLMGVGGQARQGFEAMMERMRLMGSNEGISVIDAEDSMVTTQGSAYAGISDVLLQFAQQISGALAIPLVRLLGQSPAGLNSTGESDLRMYYDSIAQRQTRDCRQLLTLSYNAIARSLGINPGKGISVAFRPLWQLDQNQRAEVAEVVTRTVLSARSEGLLTDRTALEELARLSGITGVFGHIGPDQIEQASDDLLPPVPEADTALPKSGQGKQDEDSEEDEV